MPLDEIAKAHSVGNAVRAIEGSLWRMALECSTFCTEGRFQDALKQK